MMQSIDIWIANHQLEWFISTRGLAVVRTLLWNFWAWIHPAFTAALIAIEIAQVGLFVSWRQLQYMQQRDDAVDIRGSWAETHKRMIVFRFKRELLNQANLSYPMSADNAIAALEALHVLKGQLDRMPDSTLVEQIADFLHANEAAELWRSAAFVKTFDDFARRAAILGRPSGTQE